MELTFLGISSATPTIVRHPSSQYLTIGKTAYLLDCGEGTQIQLLKFGLKAFRISKIFISHLHPDHYAGLLTLLTSMSMNGRKKSITIYCPEGLNFMLENHLYYSNGKLGFEIKYHFLNPSKETDTIYEDNEIKIQSILLEHGIDCFGFTFVTKPKRKFIKSRIEQLQIPIQGFKTLLAGKDFISEDGSILKSEELTYNPIPTSYAYITDTLYLDRIIPYLKGIKTIYHESTYAEDHEEKAILRFHSTAKQAAQIAKFSESHKLILGHFSARYDVLEVFKKEAKTIFLNTHLAEEGLTIKL